MKLIKTSLILVICLAWIFFTSSKFKPLNSVGELLTYRTGLLSVPLDENGIQKLKGYYKPKIYVDSIGIPHIYGTTQNDVAFGLGYMHAQNRYLQMEVITRTVQGRLSEIMSEQTLKVDTFWKPYEFERKSEELLEDYRRKSPEFYKYLLAYSKGVNTYLDNNENTDPFYKAIGEKPREWKPEYTLLATWYMSWSLTYFDHHIEQQEVIAELSEDVKNYFYPLQPKDLKTILPSLNKDVKKNELNMLEEAIAESKQTIRQSSNINLGDHLINSNKFHTGIGSNNWAVNKHKTKENTTLIANDPHLFLSLPEAFYETHLISESLNVYGFSIPGVPVIVSGHNDLISWGITNGEWDLVDRYKLKVKNDSLYYYENNWVPFDEKEYVIKLKGGYKHIITEKSTVHGKVLKEETGYYAQRWYASNKSYSVEAMYKMMNGENWDDFKGALKDYGYPPQNFIYSDVNDNIGIICAGKLPQRDSGYQGGVIDGSLKYIPKKNLDTLWYNYNPDEKFLFSANQQPIQSEIYFGHHGVKDDYRVKRMYNLLEENNQWELESIQKMQLDDVDFSFIEFKELLDKYRIDEDYKELVTFLQAWDGKMKPNSTAAMVYETIRLLTEIEAKNFAIEQLKVNRAPAFKYFLKYLKDDKYVIAGSRNKNEILNTILRESDSVLKLHFEDKWKEKTYKDISSFKIKNMLHIPGFGQEINNVGGNINTINLNTKKIHPVFRSVYSMKKGNVKSYTILAGGQSGKVNSVHYKDQLKSWRKGTYKETQFENNPNRLKNINNIISFQ
ncbi:penicillin acylase family protein [Aquimarina latercula]|uniref:penicillin acylase family protein n=1 Tax=Aquimarina latercula TaxID=987 RepID=UPI000554CC8A|nr:penicillin acylase family protein [Aquimarina latercula]